MPSNLTVIKFWDFVPLAPVELQMNPSLTPPLSPVHFPHFSGCPPSRPASQCGGDGAGSDSTVDMVTFG